MARSLPFATVALCLSVSTVLAAPVQASPRDGVPLARFAPGEVVNLPVPGQTPPPDAVKPPSRNLHAPGGNAPAPGAGIPFAPTGRRWMQPRIQVQVESMPPETPPDDSPTPPFLVVRSGSGRALVLAVTPPGEPLPIPRRRRLSPATPLILGLATFVFSYVATGAGASQQWENCRLDGGAGCRQRASAMMIPLAGPILVANQTRDPRQYAFATLQGAGLLLTVIGVVALLFARERRQALDARGLRISKNTAIRPDGGPGGGQLTVHASF